MSIVLISENVENLKPTVLRLQEASLNVLVNCPPGAEDVVVFCVWASEGPTPQMRQAWNVCVGIAISRWAILLCDCAAVDDAELHELVSLETAAVVEHIFGSVVAEYEEMGDYHDLRDNQPDLADRLREFARAPGNPRAFGTAGQTVDEILAAGRKRQATPRPWWKFW